MIELEQVLDKFGNKREKTTWTFAIIRANIANELKPNTKKLFRVKGYIDQLPIKQLALIPIGEGDFILPLNAVIRRQIGKESGDKVLRPLRKVDIMIFNFCTMNLVLIFLPFWPLFNLLIVNKPLLKLFSLNYYNWT
jgi:hypothetical protein